MVTNRLAKSEGRRPAVVWTQKRLVHMVVLSSVIAAVIPAWGGEARASDALVTWEARYNGPGTFADDAGASVVASPDGSKVFVTGLSYAQGGTNTYDYATIAYDALTGTQLWIQLYNGPGNNNDYGNAITISPDGSKVFVTGESYGSGTGPDYTTIAYDAAGGTPLWTSRYNGLGFHDSAHAILASPDGSTVFVTGGSSDGGIQDYHDYVTVAYDSNSGAELWVQRYNGPGNGPDDTNAIAVSPDGSKVFATGFSLGLVGVESAADYATVAYDAAAGTRLWVRRYNGPGNGRDEATSIGVSPDGSRVFITGGATVGGTSYNYVTIAYDSTAGTPLWLKKYTGGFDDFAYGLAISPSGSKVFVTGYSVGADSGDDYATVAYDAATGGSVWARRYQGPGNFTDIAYAIAVSADASKVVITGGSEGAGTGSDYASVIYDASTGTTFGVKRYDGPVSGDDDAFAVALSPTGLNVYVTGRSEDVIGLGDIATLGYVR
jgi:hypothetical protein